MTITRREFVGLGVAAAAVAGLGLRPAAAQTDIQAVIAEFTGGATPSEGGVTIGTPEIAENGNTVPVEFAVDGPAEAVEAVALFADGNPNPDVATFRFSALAGAAAASTRIRLAKTQNVYAVAKMADGTARVAMREVKVTIGGCGG